MEDSQHQPAASAVAARVAAGPLRKSREPARTIQKAPQLTTRSSVVDAMRPQAFIHVDLSLGLEIPATYCGPPLSKARTGRLGLVVMIAAREPCTSSISGVRNPGLGISIVAVCCDSKSERHFE